MQADGWIVEKISLLANPNQVRPKRFWGVYTKLKIFNMTNYKKGIVVYRGSYGLYYAFDCSQVCLINLIMSIKLQHLQLFSSKIEVYNLSNLCIR